jgi:hypothetical protein
MPDPSCFGCPSLLEVGEQPGFFLKSLGVPVCARFGKPMGSTNASQVQRRDIAKAIARNCSKFGEPRPTSVNWADARFNVSIPDMAAHDSNAKLNQDAVQECGSCEHLVQSQVVLQEMGFAAGMCAVKGNLILDNRRTYEGRNCSERSLAVNGPRTHTRGLMMLPEYGSDFTLSTDPVTYHAQMMQQFVDPTLYETDQGVTDDDKAAGIRAWRRIEDPETKNFTFLPIYEPTLFSDEERTKIPQTGSDEHPEDFIDYGFYVYKVAVLWRELDETPGLWGPAGVGKTEFFRHMAWLMQLPFERVSVTGSSELDDLAGTTHFSPDKGTFWKDGRVVSAWTKPCVLCVDEPNTGPADVWQFLRPMMDNSKQLVVDMNNESVPRDRNDNCYVGLSMNPAWDAKNVGTHVIGDADASRLMHISVPMPPEQLEKEIILKRCAHDGYVLDPEVLNMIMKIAGEIRAMCDDDTLPMTWGVRPQLQVARSSKWFDIKTCYLMAAGDFLEPEARQQVLDIVETHTE